MPVSEVVPVVQKLEADQLFVSVDGGWGIDALLGFQTRPHDDLDLVVDFEQISMVCRSLNPLGYQSHEDDMPTRLVLRASGDRRIDFHPMHFDETGFAHQRLPGGTLFTCRIDALNWRGEIDSHLVRCLSPELQLATHLGYEPDDTDRRDIEKLCDAFDFPMPTTIE